MWSLRKALALAVAAGGLIAAQAQQWQNLYPSYSGLAFGDGKFVAVSEDGLILTGDGTAWSRQYFAPAGASVYSVAYGGDRFIAMQGNTNFLSSGDGQSWDLSVTGLNFPCRYLTFGDGDFVGIGGAGYEGFTIMYDREDGWLSPVESNTSYDLSHAAYGAGRFVAVGSNIVSSNNGRGWTQRNSSGANVVAFDDAKFLAVGSKAYTSADGNTWQSVSENAPAGLRDMAYGGGKFVAVGGGKAAVSSDGTSWAEYPLYAGDDFRAVKYGGGKFVALGARGSRYTSADGTTWARQADGRVMSYKQIVYDGTRFVAVGDSGVSVSANGRDWNRAACGKGLQSVAFGGGKFVAAGDSGAIWTSADGETWSDKSRTGADHSTMFTSVAFGDGRFVVGGRASTGTQGGVSIFTSTNGGETWDPESSANSAWPGQYPVSLCHGNEKFLAGGNSSGVLKSSSDGKYWNNVTVDGAEGYRIAAITYVNSRFVALGTSPTSNIVLSSEDGTAWTVMRGALDGAKSATYAKGFYLVAADGGNIYGSQDGQTWSLQGKVTNKNLNTIYFDGSGVLLAAGAAGAMLYSSENPNYVRHNPAGRSPRYAWGMSMDNSRKTPVVTLSFTPDKPGTMAVYSLTGRQLYKKRVGAGERTISLPARMAASGSVIVRYTGEGGARTVAKRFQMVR